jgi:Flp pilus assembly protein TadG
MATQAITRYVSGLKRRSPVSRFRPLISRIYKEDDGTLVEFALCASILFSLVFGIMLLSLEMYSYIYVSDAAREATRFAMVRGANCSTASPGLSDCDATPADIQAYVQGTAYPEIVPGNLTATTTWYSPSATKPTTWSSCTGTCNLPGYMVKVAVTYTYPFSIPLVPSSALSVTSTSQIVIVQ